MTLPSRSHGNWLILGELDSTNCERTKIIIIIIIIIIITRRRIKIPGIITIEELQKISLLGTAYILLKVLSTN